MTGKITAAFVLSLLGGTYQLVEVGIAYLVDHRILALGLFGLGGIDSLTTTITSLVVFWSASRLIEDRGSARVAGPSLILAMGGASLVNLLIAITQASPQFTSLQNTPLGGILAILPGPLLLIVAGIIGLIAVRQAPPQQQTPVSATTSVH